MKINNTVINQGEKVQLTICPNVDGYEMPATVIHGATSDKVILITAGLHSGEYPGIKASSLLAQQLEPSQVEGMIIIVHCVNTSGFDARVCDVVPEDGANLNANYPGDKNGTTGGKIADFFVSEIFPQIDYIVDLHSGGKYEELTPCLFYQTAEKVTTMSERIAKATNIPYLIQSTATKGHYSYAGQMGVAGVLLERGYGGLCEREDVDGYVGDLLGILKELSFISTEGTTNKPEQKIITQAVYLASEHKGLWYPKVKANHTVKTGDLLGEIEDFYGNSIAKYYAQKDGVVFYHATDLSINVGNALVAYG